jgi:amidase
LGESIRKHCRDSSQRELVKPEAIYEIEMGLKQSAFDISTASTVRTAWHHAVHRLLERFDYIVAPTAQVFPFEVEQHWPRSIANVQMQTYHEWMKAMLLITMAGCPALAAPAGFSRNGLPIGIQIIAANRNEIACLQLARAYEAAMDPGWRRPPAILGA